MSNHLLHLGHLQLLALGNSVSLILLAPALSFTLSLGSQAENILATGGLLIEGLAGAIKLMLQVPLKGCQSHVYQYTKLTIHKDCWQK